MVGVLCVTRGVMALQVLPAHVPAPLVSFSWEELSAVPYAPVSNALHEASWLTASAYRAACEMPDALAGASSQEFEWALSVSYGNNNQPPLVLCTVPGQTCLADSLLRAAD